MAGGFRCNGTLLHDDALKAQPHHRRNGVSRRNIFTSRWARFPGKRIVGPETFCNNGAERLCPPHHRPHHPRRTIFFRLDSAFGPCKMLLSAIELELFTELAKHPLPRTELQGRLGLHPRSARDFFDALVATGFLERDGDIYRNTPATDLYLDKRKPTYMGGMLEMCNRRLYPFWSHLTEALRTGRPQNEARDGSLSLFEALYAEPARLKEFLRAMTGLSRGANQAIARQFPWNTYRTFADIGTAQGDLAVQIAAHNTHLQGIGFDLPEIAPIFEEYAQENGVAERLRFQPGDFFKDPFPTGGCDHHGPHPARLESRSERDADPQGV